MTHWTERFQALAYEKGAQGPAAFDCWSFFRHVQREQFARDVPFAPTPEGLRGIAKALRDRTESFGWLPVEKPVTGDGVFMAQMRHPHHVGIYVDDVGGGAVLHCLAGVGSCLHTLFHLKVTYWRLTGIYRPATELEQAQLPAAARSS